MESINILICQLAVTQKKDLLREWVEAEEVKDQLERVWSIIDGSPCNFAVFPETCYFPEFYSNYVKHSENRLIIAGSSYNDEGLNETHVFENGKHRAIRKIFPSPVEVMELNHPNTSQPDSIIREWENDIENDIWPDYFIDIPGGLKAAVLTCMDYYRLGYFLANSSIISPRLWGMVAPSSNGRQDIFLRLTRAIHDVNEKVYSIVVNSRDNSRPTGWNQGGSYIYGPITGNVKRQMTELGQSDSHNSAIYRLGENASLLSMRLSPGDNITFFARSKNFHSNPTRIKEYEL